MNRFRLGGQLGNGSYSEVFQAENLESGECIALKIMKQSYERGKQAQDMELFTLRKFAFVPTVVPLLESFMHAGHLNLVFQLLETNLIDYYKDLRTAKGRDISVSEIKSVLYQICLALDAMHREGYAHRDIKPQNVLIRRAGRYLEAKLTDFGLTKKLDKLHNTNYVATRWYRSPELLLNMRYDISVDVFALGCLMVELYIGFEPFPGINTVDQLNKIFAILGTPTEENWPEGYRFIQEKGISFHHYEPIDMAANVPGICPEGVHLIQHMLVNNPKERLTTADILAHPYFYDVRPLLPPRVLDYLKRQEDVDAHRPRSSQSAKSAAWPAVPRLNGQCFSPVANPLSDIRSEIKSSEKSTDITHIKSDALKPATITNYDNLSTSRDNVQSKRVQSSGSQKTPVSHNNRAAANLSNSLNNVKVSFELDQASMLNKSNNRSAAFAGSMPLDSNPSRVAAPAAESSPTNSWQVFTRQSPSVVINYSNRQQKPSQPVDFSSIRNASRGLSDNISAGLGQTRPNYDRSLLQPQAQQQRNQQHIEDGPQKQRAQQARKQQRQQSQKQRQYARAANISQPQIVPMPSRHRQSKLQYTMQHNFHSGLQSKSPSRSPSPHNPQPVHFAGHRHPQQQRPVYQSPPKQPKPQVSYPLYTHQPAHEVRVEPPRQMQQRVLRTEEVGGYAPTPTSTKNSMSSVIYYNRPSSNSFIYAPSSQPLRHMDTIVSVKEPTSQLEPTTSIPYEQLQYTSMCDAICDYFHVDAQQLEYTIGEKRSYYMPDEHESNCCRRCCLPPV